MDKRTTKMTEEQLQLIIEAHRAAQAAVRAAEKTADAALNVLTQARVLMAEQARALRKEPEDCLVWDKGTKT